MRFCFNLYTASPPPTPPTLSKTKKGLLWKRHITAWSQAKSHFQPVFIYRISLTVGAAYHKPAVIFLHTVRVSESGREMHCFNVSVLWVCITVSVRFGVSVCVCVCFITDTWQCLCTDCLALLRISMLIGESLFFYIYYLPVPIIQLLQIFTSQSTTEKRSICAMRLFVTHFRMPDLSRRTSRVVLS